MKLGGERAPIAALRFDARDMGRILALIEAEEWQALDRCSEGVVVAGLDGKIIHVSKPLLRMAGIKIEAMLGRECCDFGEAGSLPAGSYPGIAHALFARLGGIIDLYKIDLPRLKCCIVRVPGKKKMRGGGKMYFLKGDNHEIMPILR